jgi:hypothetical protein
MQWSFFSRVYNDVPYEMIHRPNTDQNYRMSSKYYNRVYLCVEDLRPYNVPNKDMPIKGFVCKEFSDFEFADEEFQAIKMKKGDVRSTMIPICKWSPRFLDRFLLDIYLKKIFWLGKHSISSPFRK